MVYMFHIAFRNTLESGIYCGLSLTYVHELGEFFILEKKFHYILCMYMCVVCCSVMIILLLLPW